MLSKKKPSFTLSPFERFMVMTMRFEKSLWWCVDRMPVILKGQDTIDSWLNDNLSEDVMKKLTQPYEAPDLVRMQPS